MNVRNILIITLFMICFGVSAQPPETTYPGTAAIAGYADDASYGPFEIGFTFKFFGINYTQFYINSNGMITFGTGSSDGVSVAIPDPAVPNNFIAPFWDDLVVDPSGKILYTTFGSVGSRLLVVQFLNMGFYTNPVFMGTFQVILKETSNTIQIQYRQIVDATSARAHGSTATIGLENAAGTGGKQYAYYNPTAITPEQAILFTPSGLTYIVNSNAVYDGIYLTTNLSLPGPGITNLISPPQNAIIGANYKFEWAAASYATSYKLYISNNSDLSGATSYDAGTNLNYDITGLTLDVAYYWGVFATNATGTSWYNIQKFTTSSIPPLAPVPQSIWTEQFHDKTTQLLYSGGGVSPKTAIITSLPAQGQLYQYNTGVRGSLISSVPATVTDANRNVIYAATGSSGNGVGNFNFKINDAGGDSPIGTMTMNVSPPGVPNLLYAAKNANVEIQFDIPMADPAGKQNQFTVKVNGTPATISSASLKAGDPYTILLTLALPLIGTETVLLSYTLGDVTGSTGGFLFPFTNQPVNLTAQTITFSQSLSKKYSDSPFTLTASSSSGMGMTYSSTNLAVVTAAGSVLTFHALGSSDITARQAGNVTYAPANYVRTLTVAKGDQTITFGALTNKTYGDADYTPIASASSALSVSFASDNPAVATIAGSQIHIVGAGTAVITASQAGNTLWNPALSVPRTLTVSKANQTITFNVLTNKTYGDADYSPAASASSALIVSFSSDNPAVATIISGNIHIIGAGTDVITASQSGNTNYNAATSVTQTLTVSKAALMATSDNKNKTYGDVNPALTITYTGFVGTDDQTVLDIAPVSTTTALQFSNTGTYPVVPAGGSDNNYTLSYTNGTLTIGKAGLMVTADNKTKIYGDINPALTITYTGFVGADDQTVLDIAPVLTTTALQFSNTGTYPVVPAGGSDNNYTLSYTDGTLTIGKAGLMATADNKTKIYGDVNPALTITYAGFVGADDQTVLDIAPVSTTTALQFSNTGTYPVVPAGGSDNNYTLSYTDGTLTIGKAGLLATADNKTKTYLDVNPPLTITYTGFLGTDNETVLDVPSVITTTALQNSNTGTYPIAVSGGSDNNYTFSYTDGVLTINKADQTIAFGVLTNKIYGDADFTVTASASSTLSVSFASDNSAVATIAGSQIHITGAGTSVITASQTGNGNYNAAPSVPLTLTVGKAGLTFTADDKSKQYQAQVPVLTYTVSGFVNGETQSVLDILPAIQTIAVQNSPTGNYPITITGGSDNNYTFIYIPGTLTITKLQQTITFTGVPARLLVEDVYTLAATSTWGLPVLFESNDISVATVSGDRLTGVSKGSVQIRAYNQGDLNYDAAEVFATVVVYSTHKDIMHLFTPNNDGFNDQWELPDLAAWGKCDVKVYNRWGKLVFSDANYNNLWEGTSNGSPLPEGAYYFIINTQNAGVVKGTVNIVR